MMYMPPTSDVMEPKLVMYITACVSISVETYALLGCICGSTSVMVVILCKCLCVNSTLVDLFLCCLRGTEEQFGISGGVDIINSTLSKVLGGAVGGYTTGPKELITLLRQESRPYIFSSSPPPPVVAGAIKVC